MNHQPNQKNMNSHEFPPTAKEPEAEELEAVPMEVKISEPKKETPESKTEVERSPKNVKELIADWIDEYETTDNEQLKKELGYKILQMELAISKAKLDPAKVKLARFDDNTLGLYNEVNGQISLGEDALELRPNHFVDITYHEGTHAGKTTHGRRIMDEGLTEWQTRHKLPNALGGFYVTEQAKAKKAFGDKTGLAEAVAKYDYDAPLNLVRWYLEVEFKDLLAGQHPEDAAAFVHDHLKKIKKTFKEAVPELSEHLKHYEFNFEAEALKIMEELSKGRSRAAA